MSECKNSIVSQDVEYLVRKIEAQHGERYRVEGHKEGFWPNCVVCGNGEQKLYIGNKSACLLVARRLQQAFFDGVFALSQQVEAEPRHQIAVGEWRPINTAPTDGSRVLLYGQNGKIADGHYGVGDGWANPQRFVWPYIHANPTHWMPLPGAPK